MSGPLSLPLSDIAFIQSFAAFCRTKGDERYRPDLAEQCALAQFGYPRLATRDQLREAGVPWAAYKLAIGCNDDGSDVQPYLDFRFSALADRLDALLAHAPMVSK